MLIEGNKIVQYLSKNNRDVNFMKIRHFHFKNSIDEKVSLNCLFINYVVYLKLNK